VAGNLPNNDALKLDAVQSITHNRFLVPGWGALRFDLHVPSLTGEQVESLTGFDFFSNLPLQIQNVFEIWDGRSRSPLTAKLSASENNNETSSLITTTLNNYMTFVPGSITEESIVQLGSIQSLTTLESSITKISTFETGVGKYGLTEISTTQVDIPHVSFAQVSFTKVGINEIGVREGSTPQYSLTQIDISQVGTFQINSTQINPTEIPLTSSISL
jgi:hypothetical protein